MKSIITFLVILLALAVPALAQQGQVTDDDVNAIAKKMYCPVCENIPLDVCGTAACAQWRGEIRTQLESGRTEDEVISDFVQRFGDRVVGTPQDPMLRTLSLVTPWIIIAVAAAVGVLTFLRWRRRPSLAAASGSPSSAGPIHDDDFYRTQLEQDLQTRR